MGKKRTRSKVTSKGVHSSINRGLVVATRAERDSWTNYGFKIDAWKKQLNPWLTVQNPNKSQTNRPFIRVRANEYLGNPRAQAD